MHFSKVRKGSGSSLHLSASECFAVLASDLHLIEPILERAVCSPDLTWVQGYSSTG